jgi:hypothetical protein
MEKTFWTKVERKQDRRASDVADRRRVSAVPVPTISSRANLSPVWRCDSALESVCWVNGTFTVAPRRKLLAQLYNVTTVAAFPVTH